VSAVRAATAPPVLAAPGERLSRLVLSRFGRHRPAVVSAAVIALLALVSLLAGRLGLPEALRF
jgi:hypothetical protein